jgi:hypothetical protein
MIILASTWLGLSLLLCVFAWYARRWVALTLPVAVALAALAVYLPTGSPRFTKPPPGDYDVVGADIVPNVGIWVLLKEGSAPPVYFRLPYSNSQADKLQSAMDGEGGVKAKVGQEGGVIFDGPPPVTGEPPKAPEQPAVTIP